jgi:hypothetical protein
LISRRQPGELRDDVRRIRRTRVDATVVKRGDQYVVRVTRRGVGTVELADAQAVQRFVLATL